MYFVIFKLVNAGTHVIFLTKIIRLMNSVKECLTSDRSCCSQPTSRTSAAVGHRKGLASWNERVQSYG